MEVGITGWIVFNAAILCLLALDLGVVQRKAHAPSLREATLWSIVWIALGLGFGAFIYATSGAVSFQQYLAGYIIEKSLSVDNIFVFYVVFSYFNVPLHLRHKVLFFGILGALIMRGLMIALGVFLIAKFHWILYVFGILLIVTGIRMAFHREETLEVDELWIVRLVRRFIPLTEGWRNGRYSFAGNA